MCRFCAKARMSAENDIYASFLDEHTSIDAGLVSSTVAVDRGMAPAPGSAEWKARRTSAEKSTASSSNYFAPMTQEEKREAELCAALKRRRIPTTILTGFLGSGKTTLLNRLLDVTSLKLAVIENEVGEVSVDDKLIETSGNTKDLFQAGTARAKEVILLPNGCMCCRVRGDLRDAFKRIVKTAYAPSTGTSGGESQRRGLDGLVLELSGLSELGPVVQTFFSDPFVQATLGIDSIVCVVDASNLSRTLSQGSALIFEQLSLADTVVLNKIDMLPGGVKGPAFADIAKVVHSVNSTAKLLPLSLKDHAQPLPAAFGPTAFMKTNAFSKGVVLSDDTFSDAVFGFSADPAPSYDSAASPHHEAHSTHTHGGSHSHGDSHAHGAQHHHDTLGYSSFAVSVPVDGDGKPALVIREKLLQFLDDMHDEGKRLLLARDGEDSSNKKMKLEDVVSPIIRCKGILVDTKHQRIALQGLYEQHELFDLPSRKEKSNQIVFIGAIPEVLQSKIRVEVTSCFTNAEAIKAKKDREAAAKKAAFDANASYFERAMKARAKPTSAAPAQPQMSSYKDTSFLRKGVGGFEDASLGMDMF